MTKFTAFLLVIVCAACAAIPGTGSIPAGYSQTSERWIVSIDGQAALVRHEIWLDGVLLQMLKGTPAVDPSAIIMLLERQGGIASQCQSEPNQGGIRFTCRYGYIPRTVGSAREISIPFLQVLPTLLNNHPILSARGVVFNWSARIDVQGAFTQIPDSVSGVAGPGHFVQFRFRLTKSNQLEGSGQEIIPPGESAKQQTPATASYLPNYMPTPLAWMAFTLGLVWALWVIWRAFPVQAVQRTTPPIWHPRTAHLPQPLRWMVQRLAMLVNWLLRNWPGLLNFGTAVTAIIAGIWLLIFARSLAVVNESSLAFRELLSRLPVVIPLDPTLDLSTWSGWVYILTGSGLLCLAMGIGLMLHKEFSRVLMCAILLSSVGFMLVTIPARLLAPALFPFYYEVTIFSFVVSFGSVLILWRAFTHPVFRSFMQQRGENR